MLSLLVIQIYILPLFSRFFIFLHFIYSCHLFDDSKAYEEHLKDLSDPNFVLIRRMVKMVTNFARTGWEFEIYIHPILFWFCCLLNLLFFDSNHSNLNSRNPSIEYDTPLESITSPEEILVHDIKSDSRTRIIKNILEQTHFNAWQEIDEIYKKMYIDFDYHIDYCNAPTCDVKRI